MQRATWPPTANFSRGRLTVWRVTRATGALTPMAASVTGLIGAGGVAWSPSGSLVAVTHDASFQDKTSISVLRVNSVAGTVTHVSGSPFTVSSAALISRAGSLVWHPSGNLLASVDQLAGVVHVFRINQTTGAVTEAAGSPVYPHPTDAPRHLTFSPDGTFLATANQGYNGCCGTTVSMFRVNATTGALTPITQGPVMAGEAPNSVTFYPSGVRLVTANAGFQQTPLAIGSITSFDVNTTTGVLSGGRTSTRGSIGRSRRRSSAPSARCSR